MRIDYGDRYEKWPFFIWCKLWLLWLSIINGIVQFFAAHIPDHHVTNAWEPYSIDLVLNSQGHRTFFWAVYNISLGHTLFHFCHLNSTKASEELLFKWLDCYADEIGLCRRGTRYHAFLHIYSTPCFMHRCPLSIIQQATLLVVSPTCDTTTPSVTE